MFKCNGKLNNIDNKTLYLKNGDIQNDFPLIVELFKLILTILTISES